MNSSENNLFGLSNSFKFNKPSDDSLSRDEM